MYGKETIQRTLKGLFPELLDLAKQMYEHPELGGREYMACQLHAGLLNQYGFSVERGVCGLPTGYLARYESGKGGPTIAFLAEYDALPAIGHGCGHNLVGACALGAGIALRYAADELGGTVLVFGCPAEETAGAKVNYVDAGLFEGVDAAILCHPGSAWCRSGSALAIQPLQFEFFGKAAHAAAAPEQGINALDAAVMTINAINALRQQIRDDERIHGIIVDGGKAANVVPDYTRMQYYVRSPRKSTLAELTERVVNCARAGALATGCRVEVSRFEPGYDDLRTNETLSDLYSDLLREEFGIEAKPPREHIASTDLGNVSQVCPAIQPYFDITGDPGVASHTAAMAQATQSPYAAGQFRAACTTMALTGAALLADTEKLAAVRREFEAAER